MDLVEALVDQSLLSVTEVDGACATGCSRPCASSARCAWPSPGSGERRSPPSPPGRWRWPTAPATQLFGDDQVGAVDEISREENNLADVLRRAMAEDDAPMAVNLIATMGIFWAITGNNPRVFAMVDASERLLETWEPPPEMVPATQEALSILISHMGFFADRDLEPMVVAMERLGQPKQPWARAMYAMFVEAESEGRPPRDGAQGGRQRRARDGDDGAAVGGQPGRERGRHRCAPWPTPSERWPATDEHTTPWQRGMLHTQMALLAMQVGDPRTARRTPRSRGRCWSGCTPTTTRCSCGPGWRWAH